MASTAPHFSGNEFPGGSDSRSENANVTGNLNVRESAAAREIKKVLVWENPLVSLSYFMGVHVLFWFLIYTELKFYGLMFAGLLMLSLRQLWNDQFHTGNSSPEFGSCFRAEPDPNPAADDDDSTLTLSNVNKVFDECWETVKSISRQLQQLRQQQPGTFCVFVCILFIILCIIGRTLSNLALLYLLVLTVITVPAILVRLLPPGILQVILNFFHSSYEESESVNREEDYLPEANSETLDILRLASDLRLTDDEDEEDDFLLDHMTCRTNDTADSFCSRFSVLTGTCPHMADNLECLACEFSLGQSMERSEYSDESESSEINFVSKHFNGETDDEDRSEFSEFIGHVLEEESRASLLDAISMGPESENLSESLISQEREASSETESFEEITEEDI